jgi:spore germination protein YaaH
MPIQLKELIEAELAQREFMPEILRINQVSSFATPSMWDVWTNKGSTQLILKAEDQIWRLKNNRILITDKNGVNFMINNIEQLDKHSRKLLDRFL